MLKEDGSIDWVNKAPKGGYVLDCNGKAIKDEHIPHIGDVIDRYGSSSGRYTSPVINNQPYSYDQRSLPFVEDPSQYHQYKVVGDFTKLEQYIKECPDNTLKDEINEYIDTYYEGDFSKLKVYQGEIAEVNGWGKGGGMQLEFPLKVEWLEKLGMLQEIK